MRTYPLSVWLATALWALPRLVQAEEAPIAGHAPAATPSAASDAPEAGADGTRAGEIPTPDDAPSPSTANVTRPPVIPLGYVEAFYQWNFANPDNRITAHRGFDDRHDTFTLANVALGASLDVHDVYGRIVLQVGHTPNAYYASEPTSTGGGGAVTSDASTWKYVQQAFVGARVPRRREISGELGIFLSPIGPESMAIHDDWCWSRSNLFVGLPFYHTGARLAYRFRPAWTATLAAYNGWNSVVDDNRAKSLSGQLVFANERVSASFLYFTGRERPTGAPEHPGFRHLFDAYATVALTRALALQVHADAGFEPTRFGTDAWVGGALAARYAVLPYLFVAARADVLYEHVPSNASGRAAPIFAIAPWVASQTLTVEARAREHLSVRLELRHDGAGEAIFFGGHVLGDGRDAPYVPNRRQQTTLTLGATSWF